MKKILSLLNENICSDISIDFIAEKLNYSKSSLFKVFNSDNLKEKHKNSEIKKICQTIVSEKEFVCKSLGSLKYDFVIFDKVNKLDYIIEFEEILNRI